MESRKMYAKAIPGKDANLPPYIKDRMVELGYSPTLTQLGLGTGMDLSVLRRNLSALESMRLTTAKKIADFLKVSVNDLIENIPTLVRS